MMLRHSKVSSPFTRKCYQKCALLLTRQKRSNIHQCQSRRGMAVYALGHGWTGALGTGKFDDHIRGHDDEEITDPLYKLYDGDVLSAAAGWGHTAIITKEYYTTSSGDSHYDSRLLMCGRPHDLLNLLRLYRFPAWMRLHAVHWTNSYKHDEYAFNVTALASRFIQWMLNERWQEDKTLRLWELAKAYSIMSELEEVEMPNYDAPGFVIASAGLTAVIGQVGGTLYTMGLNNRGQCGVGYVSNNVWVPQQVMGLSEDYAQHGREYLYQAYPIDQVALGLQHGYAVCTQGNLYSWGKGERFQLGQDKMDSGRQFSVADDPSISDFARHVRKAIELDREERPDFFFLPRVVKVASGNHHGAALCDNNQVFVWGKNVIPPLESDRRLKKRASDARSPIALNLKENLHDPNLKVVDVTCGSHHTSILMEDGSVYGVGITTDIPSDFIFEPVMVVPPGIIDMPCRQFEGHFDRTTVVGSKGDQILQFHLWKDPELRDFGVFTPFWVDSLLQNNNNNDDDDDEDYHQEQQQQPSLRIRSVHRGWLHTIVVTDEDDQIGGPEKQHRIEDGREKLVVERKETLLTD